MRKDIVFVLGAGLLLSSADDLGAKVAEAYGTFKDFIGAVEKTYHVVGYQNTMMVGGTYVEADWYAKVSENPPLKVPFIVVDENKSLSDSTAVVSNGGAYIVFNPSKTLEENLKLFEHAAFTDYRDQPRPDDGPKEPLLFMLGNDGISKLYMYMPSTSEMTMEVYDMFGRTVSKRILSVTPGENYFDMNFLPNGNYIAKVHIDKHPELDGTIKFFNVK